MNPFAAAVLCVLLCSSALGAQEQETGTNRDPDQARLVTSDIDNFWRAYDLASREPDRARRVAIFQSEYLDRGSPGLRDFVRLRIKSAEDLVAAIERLPRYYASIRPSTLRVGEMEEKIRASFRRFKELYPDAVFPDVYFLIGVSNTGGTVGPSGLLIGAEMYGMTPETPREELPAWMGPVLKSVDQLPAIVAHESCHSNQRLGELRTLLAKSIQEGSCDLVGELISGSMLNPAQKAYGDAHEVQLWREFEAEMNGTEVRNWMYNGLTVRDRPTDLGYYIGYRIARAYYHNAPDKKQALRDVLTVQDFAEFLERSRYRDTLAR